MVHEVQPGNQNWTLIPAIRIKELLEFLQSFWAPGKVSRVKTGHWLFCFLPAFTCSD